MPLYKVVGKILAAPSVLLRFGNKEKRLFFQYCISLFQLQSIAIVASIFTTVVLALERCLAVAKPIEYHNAVQVSSYTPLG